MAVVLREQLELRPSVALQKKVGLKSLEQVIRWGDRVNQELRRLRKLEDRKCWRARARRIRKSRPPPKSANTGLPQVSINSCCILGMVGVHVVGGASPADGHLRAQRHVMPLRLLPCAIYGGRPPRSGRVQRALLSCQ
eukprot:COSAG04_NODE_1463_length_6616_cov_16.965782_6_plen_138_part_00